MKKIMIGGLVTLLTVFSLAAAYAAMEDVDEHLSCKQCGMNRGAFAQSRMLIRYGDGQAVGTCSIRCAAVELGGNKGKDVRAILVADYNTRELIDATKADWVIQYGIKGVMTKDAKWAFRSSEALEVFIRGNGGARSDWGTALRVASEELREGKTGDAAPAGEAPARQTHHEKCDCCCCRQ